MQVHNVGLENQKSFVEIKHVVVCALGQPVRQASALACKGSVYNAIIKKTRNQYASPLPGNAIPAGPVQYLLSDCDEILCR